MLAKWFCFSLTCQFTDTKLANVVHLATTTDYNKFQSTVRLALIGADARTENKDRNVAKQPPQPISFFDIERPLPRLVHHHQASSQQASGSGVYMRARVPNARGNETIMDNCMRLHGSFFKWRGFRRITFVNLMNCWSGFKPELYDLKQALVARRACQALLILAG